MEGRQSLTGRGHADVFSDVLEEFLRHHETQATRSSAPAGIILVALEVKAVIERNLLTSANITASDYPNMVALHLGFAIRGAAVIDESRWIPLHTPVNVLVIVE